MLGALKIKYSSIIIINLIKYAEVSGGYTLKLEIENTHTPDSTVHM